MRNTCSAKGPWAVLLLGAWVMGACQEQTNAPEPPALSASQGQDPELSAKLEAARQAVLETPNDLSLRREFAMLLDANALDQSAQQAWQQVLSLDPALASAWYHLSKVSERIGDEPLSFEAMQRCVELDPSYGPAQARLGRLLMERGETDRAREAYLNASRLDPRSPRGALGLARLHLAQGAAQPAIDLLEPLLARNPREPHVNGLLARAYVLLDDEPRAERHLQAEERAGAPSGGDRWAAEVRQRATGKLARISRAKALLERGDAQGAMSEIEPLWASGQVDQALIETTCQIRMAQGQPEEVLTLLQDNQGAFEATYAIWLYRARAQRALGQDVQALEAAARAAELQPRRLEASALAGQLYFDQGRHAEAVEALVRARAHGDESLQTLAFLGRARAGSGDLEGGLQDLEQATLSHPSVPKPWAYRAELLAMQGRADEARASLERATALGLDPNLAASIGARLSELGDQE